VLDQRVQAEEHFIAVEDVHLELWGQLVGADLRASLLDAAQSG